MQIFIPKNCFTGINFGYKTPNSQEKGMARKLREFECFGFTLFKKVFDIYSNEFRINLKLCVFETPSLISMREKLYIVNFKKLNIFKHLKKVNTYFFRINTHQSWFESHQVEGP